MTTTLQFEKQTKALIDDLKVFVPIMVWEMTAMSLKLLRKFFLYKFLNDKFIHEIKQLDKKLAKAENLQAELKKYKKKRLRNADDAVKRKHCAVKARHNLSLRLI
jgi:type I restriction enzyme M protein